MRSHGSHRQIRLPREHAPSIMGLQRLASPESDTRLVRNVSWRDACWILASREADSRGVAGWCSESVCETDGKRESFREYDVPSEI